MIREGDKIAVGVSAGKDSLTLLCALADLRRFYPKKFELCAITVDMGFEGMDFSPFSKLCEELLIQKKDNIALLKKMDSCYDDFLDNADDLADVTAFFKNQKAIFDSALAMLQKMNDEKDYLQQTYSV
jgi:tRNA(Ile)-lysidine synthase TilS/MesJ